MNAVDLDEAVLHIQAYAKALIQGIRVMDERRHILQPLLRDDDVKRELRQKFEGTYGAHAYNHLAPLLAQDLVRDISRLYLDDDRRTGSFVNLYRKSSQPDIYKHLREHFTQIPVKWHDQPGPIPGLSEAASERIKAEWKDRDREDFAESFDKGWAAARSAIEELEHDPIAQKVKTFRDKHHAHLEMTAIGSDPGPFDVSKLGLTFNDILDFSDRYMNAAFELARVLTGQVYDVEGFSDVHRKYGEDMWRILAGLGDQKERRA
jgi:hypothetical protein